MLSSKGNPTKTKSKRVEKTKSFALRQKKRREYKAAQREAKLLALAISLPVGNVACQATVPKPTVEFLEGKGFKTVAVENTPSSKKDVKGIWLLPQRLTKKSSFDVCKPYAEERLHKVLEMYQRNRCDVYFDMKVTVVSNTNRRVAFHGMKGLRADEYTTMPFKLLLLCGKPGMPYIIYDEDHSEEYQQAVHYYKNVFKKGDQPCFKRFFTVMSASYYYMKFSSDRNHWKVRGKWIAPAPKLVEPASGNWFVSVLPNDTVSDTIQRSLNMSFYDEKDFKKTFGHTCYE